MTKNSKKFPLKIVFAKNSTLMYFFFRLIIAVFRSSFRGKLRGKLLIHDNMLNKRIKCCGMKSEGHLFVPDNL